MLKKLMSLFILLSFLTTAGCVVGPSFNGTTNLSIPEVQPSMVGDTVAEGWKDLFNSDDLDNIIRSALKASPTLAAAQAALREASEELNATTGATAYPSADAQISSTRMKTSPAAAGLPEGKGNIFDLHHASVNVSYAFDIFGGKQRAIEALKARVDYQRFQLEASYLALTSNIVTAVISEASLREQLIDYKKIVSIQEVLLGMLHKQFDLGGVSRLEVLAQQDQLERAKSALPSLEQRLVTARHQLTLLLGKMPEEQESLPIFDWNMIGTTKDIPVGVPSFLVRQRPDIQAAESLLHAASAGIGQAKANLYPQLTLNGTYGPEAGRLGNLLDADNIVWNIGAGVLQPVFNGGALRAKQRSAQAAYDQSAAHFRQTVLLAFQHVADALRALESDAMSVQVLQSAEAVARDTLKMTRKQFELGAISRRVYLTAMQQFSQARILRVEAQAAQRADTAALFLALGGGWWGFEIKPDLDAE